MILVLRIGKVNLESWLPISWKNQLDRISFLKCNFSIVKLSDSVSSSYDVYLTKALYDFLRQQPWGTKTTERRDEECIWTKWERREQKRPKRDRRRPTALTSAPISYIIMAWTWPESRSKVLSFCVNFQGCSVQA